VNDAFVRLHQMGMTNDDIATVFSIVAALRLVKGTTRPTPR